MTALAATIFCVMAVMLLGYIGACVATEVIRYWKHLR